jgi:TRAP-type uncharacterized transport system fused permease subunit
MSVVLSGKKKENDFLMVFKVSNSRNFFFLFVLSATKQKMGLLCCVLNLALIVNVYMKEEEGKDGEVMMKGEIERVIRKRRERTRSLIGTTLIKVYFCSFFVFVMYVKH